MAPGSVVPLTVWRDGKEQVLSATLGGRAIDTKPSAAPDQNDQSLAPPPTGLTLVADDNGKGLLVQDVTADSIAADKGFAVGDTILEVDNRKVSTPAEFDDAIKSILNSGRATALIKAERSDSVRYVGLPLEPAKS